MRRRRIQIIIEPCHPYGQDSGDHTVKVEMMENGRVYTSMFEAHQSILLGDFERYWEIAGQQLRHSLTAEIKKEVDTRREDQEENDKARKKIADSRSRAEKEKIDEYITAYTPEVEYTPKQLTEQLFASMSKAEEKKNVPIE